MTLVLSGSTYSKRTAFGFSTSQPWSLSWASILTREKASFVPGMTIPALRRLRLAGRGFFRLGRERLCLPARIFLGYPHVVERLQIHPELRAPAGARGG